MNRIGDISEVKMLYKLYVIKLARMHLLACRRDSVEEYETLKIDLRSIYDRITEVAGKPYF